MNMEEAELNSDHEVLHAKKVRRKSKNENMKLNSVKNMEGVDSCLGLEKYEVFVSSDVKIKIKERKKRKIKVNLSMEGDRSVSEPSENGDTLDSVKVDVKNKKKRKAELNISSKCGESNTEHEESGKISDYVYVKLKKKQKKVLGTNGNTEEGNVDSGHAEGDKMLDSVKVKSKNKEKELDTQHVMERMECNSEQEECGKISDSEKVKLKKKEKKRDERTDSGHAQVDKVLDSEKVSEETKEDVERMEYSSGNGVCDKISDSTEMKKKRSNKKSKARKMNAKIANMRKKLNLPEVSSFHEMELDDRLMAAIARLRWEKPSEIQWKAIPSILKGKDVVMEARTGCGKTGAFGIPVIQKIIDTTKANMEQATRALILVPSVELVLQTCRCLKQLTSQCSNITTCPLTNVLSVEEQVPLIDLGCDIVVGTPGRVLDHLKEGNLKVSSVEILVIDEVDAITVLGFEEAMTEIIRFLPKVHQTVMASATIPEKIKWLANNIMYSPLFLRTEEEGSRSLPSGLKHFYLFAKDDEKAFTLYAMFKLGLIKGRTLAFVNTVDRSYKVKLYLEQFGIKSCVVNSELPALARMHAINQFNSKKYNLVIASDEFSNIVKKEKKKGSESEKDILENKYRKQKTKRKKDAEFSASRGIDFQNVSNVILFDFPTDERVYIHRAGRAARMNNEGTVLSFVGTWQRSMLEEIERKLKERQNTDGAIFQELQFRPEELGGFRYRSNDAWRAVTRVAVREARLKEIKSELFNSQTLKGYFEDNPRDYNTLRHDKALHTVKLQPHLHHVPDYIVPPELLRWRKGDTRAGDDGIEEELNKVEDILEIGASEPEIKVMNHNTNRRKETRTEMKHKRKMQDPLSIHFNLKRK